MRLLLDTHAVLWTLQGSPRLSQSARAALSDPAAELIISAVSVFEITQKHRVGKLPQAEAFVRDHDRILADLNWTPLALTIEHAALEGVMDIPHKDPFDRLLIAQARIEQVPIVSNETLFDAFGVERIW